MSPTRGDGFVMEDKDAIDFTAFVLGLASSALIHLGGSPHPDTGQVTVDLDEARRSLDLLGLLREKTRGNLTEEEDRLFENVLGDLRLRYVEVRGT